MKKHVIGPALLLAALCSALPSRGIGLHAGSGAFPTGAGQASRAGVLSDRWQRVPSAHFTAVGDAPESVLRSALRELEVFRTALTGLSAILPPIRFRSSTPLVVVFRDDAALEPYKPRDDNGRRRSNVGGYYFDDPQGAYVVTAANGPGWGPGANVVLHEFAHDVLHSTLGTGLPPWLDEGLAELWASVGADNVGQTSGRRLGRPIPSHVTALRRKAGPGIAALLTTDHAALARMPPDDAALFYAKSWALVHYVLLGRENRRSDDVPAFLAALASGQSPHDAFASAFGVEAPDVDSTLLSYILHPGLPALPIREPDPIGMQAAIEPMLEAEVERIQGNILLQLRDLTEARPRLERSFAHDPASVETRLSLARLRTIDLRPTEALDLLAPIAADRPTTYATQLVLGRARQRAGRYAGALDAFTLATTLASPALEAWYGMSLTALLLNQPGTATEAMSRLQASDPAPAWYFERARDLWEAGRDDLVVADIQTILTREISDANGRAYAAFLGALSASRLARTPVAGGMLARVESDALAGWPRTLLAFLQGRLSARDLLGRARGSGQQTEAHTYIGITASIAGRHDEARRHLVWVRDRGVRTYAEYDMSRVELGRLP